MRDISLYGCRLDTEVILAAKTLVLVRIFRVAEFIEAPSTVIFASLDLGTALAFREMELKCEFILKRWLVSAHEKSLKKLA